MEGAQHSVRHKASLRRAPQAQEGSPHSPVIASRRWDFSAPSSRLITQKPTQLRKWSMETPSLHPGSRVRDNLLCKGGCGETRTAPQSWEWKAPPTPRLPSLSLSLSPGSQGPSQPRSTYLWGIKAALKTARVPRSHQKVPESLTRWFREDLPTNTISKS